MRTMLSGTTGRDRKSRKPTIATNTAMTRRTRRTTLLSVPPFLPLLSSAPLLIARSPRRHLRPPRREVRATEHVVEGRELAVHDIAHMTLGRLQPVLEVLMNGSLLVRRLEIRAGQAIRKVPELLNEFRSEA